MGDLPDLSRTSLHQLQQREMRGRPFRRPSNDLTRGKRDCPAEDVLYVGMGIGTNFDHYDTTTGKPAGPFLTNIRIYVYQKSFDELETAHSRRDWLEKQESVVYPLLKIMSSGVESALRSRGFLAPINWFSSYLYPNPNQVARGLQARIGNMPENVRNKETFVDMFDAALDYASGYPSKVVHTYRLREASGNHPFYASRIAALCVGQGHGQGIHTDPNPTGDPDIFGDPASGEDSDEEEDD
jgi:hypothetical protein